MNASAPESLCLLRLSALGDVSHVLPLVRQLQCAWPHTRLTWIIGKFEHRLMQLIPDIEFIVFDKKQGWDAVRQLREQLTRRRFDALLHMQLALRANLLAAWVKADQRIGFDTERSKELHGLVINRRIAYQPRQHVLDALGSFGQPLGLSPVAPRWDFPILPEAQAFAESELPGNQATLIISPCSSHRLRNWHAEGYAAVARHAINERGWRVALCGGPSALEREVGDAILQQAGVPIIDLIGRDTLPRLLALLQRADALLTPDSGPMHLANAMGTRVIGLHAATASWRSGPYSDRQFCVDHYAEAAEQFLRKPADQLPWGKRIEFEGVMDLIRIPEVIDAFERLDAMRRRGGTDQLADSVR